MMEPLQEDGMRGRREVLRMTTMGAAGVAFGLPAEAAPRQECSKWVRGILETIEQVEPGMTRAKLLSVLGVEGGLSERTQQTFVSRECPYIKVDVQFVEEAGWTDKEGRLSSEPADTDVVRTVSRPYLEEMITD